MDHGYRCAESVEVEQELNSSVLNAETDEDNLCGYGECETTFGLVRKKIYYPKSDFGLQLKEFVLAGSFTGYFCTVTRQMDRKSRFVSMLMFACPCIDGVADLFNRRISRAKGSAASDLD